ncbi:hypothetical protein NliqN6_3317 [Naganishia liquefaciens]|uniref:50S ribosomal protein L34 n=1 Tax=Naganishia liquefaciens TaxID=104408 RepID=A0A8H3TTF8_9TREE|nr:hypothetical protein NliqN6_3317 [Naganishia liquefaciens]
MPRIHPITGLFRALNAPTTLLRATTTTTISAVTRTPSLLTALRSTPTSTMTALIPSLLRPRRPSSSPILSQLRFRSYGAEYQPSQRKRKRKHGFLARRRGAGKDGLAMLTRRRKHGRRFLSH